MTTVAPMSSTIDVAHHATTGGAWLAALRIAAATANHKLLHLRVTITEPASEDTETRFLADQMLIGERHPPVQTVVNTLFPAALARACKDPADLVTRYRRMYKWIRHESPANSRGTYFGRLVCYPARDGEVDQLTRLIGHLHRDHHNGRRPIAIYEMTTSASGSAHSTSVSNAAAADGALRAETAPHDNGYQPDTDVYDAVNIAADMAVHGRDGEMQIYAPIPDTIPMGFPCLSHLSFQRDGEHLHLMAHYRHQYLVERAYGNYLALGLLQHYIAAAADLRVGHLSIDVGLATLEISPTKLRRYLPLLGQKRLW